MVTLLEIKKAIIDKIKQGIKETEFCGVKVVAEDLDKPIIRPSFKVEFDGVQSGKFNFSNKERNLTVRIYYFASNLKKYRIENYKMQDIIENAFLDDIEVKEGFFIPVDSVDSEVSDTVLICSMELYTLELIEDIDTSEYMETIDFKMGR